MTKLYGELRTIALTLCAVALFAPVARESQAFIIALNIFSFSYVGAVVWELFFRRHTDDELMDRRAGGSVAQALKRLVDCDPRILGGKYVLPGTRFPLYRILADIADDASVSEIAEDYSLDPEQIKGLFQYAAAALEKPKAFGKARVVK